MPFANAKQAAAGAFATANAHASLSTEPTCHPELLQDRLSNLDFG